MIQYFVALIVPIVLLFCGAIAKKLVRGTGWVQKDFFLGVELTLAAMSSGLLYFFELVPFASIGSVTPPSPNKVAATALFVIVCFFLLLSILSTHQDWENKPSNTKGQFARLALFSNGVGASLMCAFSLLVKGV